MTEKTKANLSMLGLTYAQIEARAAREELRNAWTCPDCGVQGGRYHLTDCYYLDHVALPDGSEGLL